MLPNWIIVGAPKCGTSSLFRWLVDHPQVAGSIEKETYYFVDPGTHMYRAAGNVHTSGIGGYEELFRHCQSDARVILESTPGYMYSRTAIERLPLLSTRPSFIFVLREPVEQLKSLFGYFKENWDWVPASMTFREFIAAAEKGTCSFKGNELASEATGNANYVEHLRRWRSVCGAKRMQIYLFEDMIGRKREFMSSLAQRLGIDAGFYEKYGFPTENESYVARSRLVQKVNIRVRSILPKGPLYDSLRRVYRAVNTRSAPSSRVRDIELEQALSVRYAGMINQLEDEFGLDVTAWRRIAAARTLALVDQVVGEAPVSYPRSWASPVRLRADD